MLNIYRVHHEELYLSPEHQGVHSKEQGQHQHEDGSPLSPPRPCAV